MIVRQKNADCFSKENYRNYCNMISGLSSIFCFDPHYFKKDIFIFDGVTMFEPPGTFKQRAKYYARIRNLNIKINDLNNVNRDSDVSKHYLKPLSNKSRGELEVDSMGFN